jgi:hypothetical protein
MDVSQYMQPGGEEGERGWRHNERFSVYRPAVPERHGGPMG